MYILIKAQHMLHDCQAAYIFDALCVLLQAGIIEN